MGITVYSLLWVMQDFDHQPYHEGALGPLNPTAVYYLCILLAYPYITLSPVEHL